MTSEAFFRLTDDQKRAYIQEIAVKIVPKIRNFEYVHPTDIFYSMPDETTVDLALPSGTLWAKCNIGATTPYEAGKYFQWGDVNGYTGSQVGGSKIFNWANYKYANGAADKLTKYCPSSKTDYWDGSGAPDNKLILDQEDDAAFFGLNSDWQMPTKEQFNELLNYTTHSWDASRSGFTFIANGEELFLFGAGFANGSSVGNYGGRGYYWSRSLNESNPSNAWRLYFGNDGACSVNGSYRCYGFSVRPVRSQNH